MGEVYRARDTKLNRSVALLTTLVLWAPWTPDAPLSALRVEIGVGAAR